MLGLQFVSIRSVQKGVVQSRLFRMNEFCRDGQVVARSFYCREDQTYADLVNAGGNDCFDA